MIKIEHNIPVPTRGRNYSNNRISYDVLFDQMSHGDSFVVNNTRLPAVYRAADRLEVELVHRRFTDNNGQKKIRFWKI